LLAAKRADKDPVEEAILSLKVTRPDRMAKIFRVDYQAGDREETDRLVEALVASYQQFLGATFQKNSGTVITLISKARDDLSKELKELEDQYLEFRRTNELERDRRPGGPLLLGQPSLALGPGGQ